MFTLFYFDQYNSVIFAVCEVDDQVDFSFGLFFEVQYARFLLLYRLMVFIFAAEHASVFLFAFLRRW